MQFGPDEKEQLIDFLNFLARVAHQGSNELHEVEGFYKWTNNDDDEEENNHEKLDWHSDPSRDGESATFESAVVSWLDENGVKMPASLQTEKLA